MNKIRVIDLLNKIANGEIPKRIIYDDKQWEYDEKKQDYFTYDDSRIDWQFAIMEYINDEIEIIEDTPKKIKKLEDYDFDELLDLDSKFECLREYYQMLKDKQDEIIDYINNEEE